MNNRVLYLTYDGLTDSLGQSQVLPYLCGLAAHFQITIISFEKPSYTDELRKSIADTCYQHAINWIPLPYHKNPPVLSTLYDLFILNNTISRLLKKNKFEIVHCRSYITALIGLSLKRKRNIKFLFDMRGFWADERVDGGLWNLKNPAYSLIYKFFKTKEREFIQEADHVISLTNNAKQEIISWKLNTPITVIPCCVDLALFDRTKIEEKDQHELKTQLGIGPNDFVLLYLGSWGTWYMTLEMIDFFIKLRKHKPESKFLIITGDHVEIQNSAIERDIIIKKIPRHKVPLFISLASCSVFFIKPAYSKKASSATKMAEIMAMNVPVITNPGWGDVEEIIQSAGGWLYETGTSDFDLKKFDEKITNGYEYCRENLSLESGITKYNAVYKKLSQE